MINIFDVSNNLYYIDESSYFIYSDLKLDSNGARKHKYNVGGVVGLLSKLYNSNDKVYMCFDSKPNIRKEKYDIYKRNRTKKDNKDMQRDLLYYIVNQVSTCAIKEDGFEADDLINYIVDNSCESKIDIYTNDKDIFHLINKNTRIIQNLNTNNSSTYLEKGIQHGKYTIPFKYIKLWKILTGDNSDNIPALLTPSKAYLVFEEISKIIPDERINDSRLIKIILQNYITDIYGLDRNIFLIMPLVPDKDILENKEGKVINKTKLKEYINVLKNMDRTSELYNNILKVCDRE